MIDFPNDLDAAAGRGQGAEFRGVGAKLIERQGKRDDSTGRDLDIGPFDQKFAGPLAVEGFDRAADDLHQAGARPSRLQQQIVRLSERDQPAFDRLLAVLDTDRRPQALRGNGAHGSQGVLDAMVQFFQDQFLQLVGRLALFGINAGLGQQDLGIDIGLLEKEPKAVVFRRQEFAGNWRRPRWHLSRAARPLHH